jgi:hypothetical protein
MIEGPISLMAVDNSFKASDCLLEALYDKYEIQAYAIVATVNKTVNIAMTHVAYSISNCLYIYRPDQITLPSIMTWSCGSSTESYLVLSLITLIVQLEYT